MVFRQAARKTGGYMVISAVLGLGIVVFLTEDLTSPAGAAVTSDATEIIGSSWLVFALGLFIGGLMIGTYFYLAHMERKREE